jgi:DNA-binding ferritin-like protein (Dps family)|tara:strand:+ start:726 stop:1097 length:372 start_codon:yes stop_codon:yes gene_type:complete
MKKFKELVQSLDEVKKFKLPRGEQEVDSYMEKGAKGKKVPVVIAKKSSKFKVYIDGQELAIYKNEKEARKNAKQLISLLGEDIDEFVDSVLDEPSIEDTLGFSNGLRGNQTYNDVAEKIATIK